jgi:hypothetical protein
VCELEQTLAAAVSVTIILTLNDNDSQPINSAYLPCSLPDNDDIVCTTRGKPAAVVAEVDSVYSLLVPFNTT